MKEKVKKDLNLKSKTENLVPYVFEQYEFKGWLITIENYMGTKELIGFATPKKYSNLLNIDNSQFIDIDEIAKQNNIEFTIDEHGDPDYGDFTYVLAEPDDVVVNFLEGINTEDSSSVLGYMVKEILRIINPRTEIERYTGISRFNDTKIVVLKQIQKVKKMIPYRTGKS